MKIKIQFIILFALSATVFVLWYLYQAERKERIRTESNQISLMEGLERYKTNDSLNAISIKRLELDKNEFKKYNSELVETVAKLNLKVNRLQSATTTATVTVTNVNTVIKDSIIYRDKDRLVRDTLRCIDFKDPWISVTGCADNNMLYGEIISRDTLQQFVHRVPRKFLFFRFGTKAIAQDMVCSNPHTVIEYSKYIELK